MTLRRSATAVAAALALAAAGCGSDTNSKGQNDSPVNTQTPQGTPGQTPAPNSSQSSKGE